MTLVQNKDELTVRTDSRLDSNNIGELEEALKEVMPWKGTLIFDLDQLQYISSAGLRVLLACQKQMKNTGKMYIRNVCDTVMEIFTMTGTSMVFDFQ